MINPPDESLTLVGEPEFDCPFYLSPDGQSLPVNLAGRQVANVSAQPTLITPANRNGTNDVAHFTFEFFESVRDQWLDATLAFEIRDSKTCQLMSTVKGVDIGGGVLRGSWGAQIGENESVTPGDYSVVAIVETKNGSAIRSKSFGVTVTEDVCVDRSVQDRYLVRAAKRENGKRLKEIFELRQPGVVCVELVSEEPSEVAPPSIIIDGGVVVSLVEHDSPVVATVPLGAGKHSLLTTGLNSRDRFNLWVAGEPAPPEPAATFDTQTCRGRLRGFAHPLGIHGEDPIARAGVVVDCVMTVRVPVLCVKARPGCRDSYRWSKVRARGRTGVDGLFSVTITKDHFAQNRIDLENATPLSLRTECHPHECGYEALGSIKGTRQGGLGTNADGWIPGDGAADTFEDMDIVNVLDFIVPANSGGMLGSLSVETVMDTFGGLGQPDEPKESAHAMLGARLLSNGQGARRNDLPLVIHEQIDVLNVEHTNFMIWGLSGQVVELQGEGVKFPPVGCDRGTVKDDEDLDPYRICDLSEEDCNASLCGQGNVRCLAEPLLQRLLADGYDVWLVDYLQGRRDLMEAAVQGPALYEAISTYPPLVIATAADGTPIVQDDPKKIAVAGISLGSVLARTSLKLWERRDNLPSGLRVDTSALNIPTAPVEERVALYISIDAPHLGARVPLALQGYIHGLPDLDQDIEDLKTRLNALPTRQFVADWVDPSKFTLNCFDSTKELAEIEEGEGFNSCTLNHMDFLPFANRDAFTDFFFRSVALLDPASADPFERRADGLPNVVPSIAVSNGLYPPTPINAGTDVVFNAKKKIKYVFGAWEDHTNHWILDSGKIGDTAQDLPGLHQPGGSGFDGVCRALRAPVKGGGGLDGAAGGAKAGALKGAKYGAIAGLLGGDPLSGAAAGGALGGLLGGFVGLTSTGSVSFRVPMAPGSKSHKAKAYPTLVPTRSSLLQLPGFREPSPTWRDFLVPRPPQKSRRHTGFEDDQCKFVMYHLAGTMTGDFDGKPNCTASQLSASCRDGGMRPGSRFSPGAFPFQACD